MKSKSSLLLLALASLAFIVPSGNHKAEFLIKKTASVLRPEDSTTYKYDTKGRLIEQHMKPIDAWWRYSYSPAIITVEHNSGVSDKNQRAEYYMSKERADSMIVIVSGDTVDFAEFVYDSNGYMTSEISNHSISVIPELKQVWKNGNLQEHIDYDNGNEYDRTYYEYYEDIPNKPHAFIFGPQLNGRTSKNLLKRIVIVRNFNDTTNVLLHRYQFDSKGRITTNAIYGKSGQLADSLEYFY